MASSWRWRAAQARPVDRQSIAAGPHRRRTRRPSRGSSRRTAPGCRLPPARARAQRAPSVTPPPNAYADRGVATPSQRDVGLVQADDQRAGDGSHEEQRGEPTCRRPPAGRHRDCSTTRAPPPRRYPATPTMANAASSTAVRLPPVPQADDHADPVPIGPELGADHHRRDRGHGQPDLTGGRCARGDDPERKPPPVWAALATIRPRELRRGTAVGGNPRGQRRPACVTPQTPRHARVVVPAEHGVVAQPAEAGPGRGSGRCHGRPRRRAAAPTAPAPSRACGPSGPVRSVHRELVHREVEVVSGETVFDEDPAGRPRSQPGIPHPPTQLDVLARLERVVEADAGSIRSRSNERRHEPEPVAAAAGAMVVCQRLPPVARSSPRSPDRPAGRRSRPPPTQRAGPATPAGRTRRRRRPAATHRVPLLRDTERSGPRQAAALVAHDRAP